MYMYMYMHVSVYAYVYAHVGVELWQAQTVPLGLCSAISFREASATRSATAQNSAMISGLLPRPSAIRYMNPKLSPFNRDITSR